MIIRNRASLISKGNARGREFALSIIETALQEVNSFNLVKSMVKLENNQLAIGKLNFDLNNIGDIFVVGGGKQVTFVAAALEELLQSRIREGVVVEKKGWGRKLSRIRVVEGGHPVPDEGTLEGADSIIRTVKKAKNDDLVLVCVTGGCTSLTLSPPDGITLKDVIKISQLLLESGATVEEMNAVRKHLSRIGGGKLALLTPQAKVVSLIAVDEVAGVPWGPTVPDATTFSDARNVLMKYGLWNKTPRTIRDYLARADINQETPKSSDFVNSGVKVTNIVFAENGMLCKAAERRATELGLNTTVLTTRLEGEAKDVGIVLSSIANEIEAHQRPLKTPCALIAGGETTVTIRGDHGEGGRNQELALAAAIKISGNERAVLVSIGTDGTDGPTDIAGAIVDGYSTEEAKHKGMDLFRYLKRHDSSNAFRKLGDAIYTSNTGTNLMDLTVLCVT